MSFEKDEIDKKEFARHIGDAIKSRRVEYFTLKIE